MSPLHPIHALALLYLQTLLPMAPAGELCSIDGSCVDAADDEIFKLSTRGGGFWVFEGLKYPGGSCAFDVT